MTKITLHWQQRAPAWAPQYLDRTGALYAKAMNAYPDIPGKRIIGRFHLTEATTNAMIERGAAGADEYWAWVRGLAAQHPHLWAIEGPNEPSIWHWPVLQGFNAFYLRLAELFHAAGLRLVAGNINVGWPNFEQIPYLAAGLCAADYIALHEYAWPNLWDNLDTDNPGEGWWTLRYRKTHRWLTDAGHADHPPFLITELGLDSGVAIDGPHQGWRVALMDDHEEYAEQLLWYEKRLQENDYVEAATVFVSEPEQTWATFDWHEAAAMAFAALVEQEPDPPPPPPPPGGDMKIRYYLLGQKVSEDEFRAVFGNGYQPKKDVGDGSNDDFPDILKAQIHEMHQVDNMALRCQLRMLDGSVPADIDKYEFITWIHGNDYRANFVVADDGKAYAEWIMGHDGWWYNPQDGSAGAGICFVGRKDGELHSEQVRGVGWCSVEGYGGHAHANLVFTIEPSGEPPPPPPPATYTVSTLVVPENAGSVDPKSIIGIEHGTEVTLEAIPGPQMLFDMWADQHGNTNTNNPVTFAVTENLTITAYFRPEDVPPPPPPGPTPEDIERAKVKIVGIVELARGAYEDLGGTFAELLDALGWWEEL